MSAHIIGEKGDLSRLTDNLKLYGEVKFNSSEEEFDELFENTHNFFINGSN